MTTDEAIKTLEEVGLMVKLKDGVPVLVGDRAKVTPTLLAMLRWHRKAIVERLGGGPAPDAKPAPPPAPAGGGPPCPELIVWRLCGEVGWAFPTAVDREHFVRRHAPIGWRPPGNSGWRELSELPPSWGFRLPEAANDQG